MLRPSPNHGTQRLPNDDDDDTMRAPVSTNLAYHIYISTASVAEWLRAWDTWTMFEATVCGRS